MEMSWQCDRQRTDNVSKCKLVSDWSSPPQCSSLIGRGSAAAAARLLLEQRPRGLAGLSSGRERAVALLEWGEWREEWTGGMSESSHGELAPFVFGAGFGGFRAPLVTISKFCL